MSKGTRPHLINRTHLNALHHTQEKCHSEKSVFTFTICKLQQKKKEKKKASVVRNGWKAMITADVPSPYQTVTRFCSNLRPSPFLHPSFLLLVLITTLSLGPLPLPPSPPPAPPSVSSRRPPPGHRTVPLKLRSPPRGRHVVNFVLCGVRR